MTPDKQAEREEAYEAGWRTCANWMNRDDLISDVGSPAYVADMQKSLCTPVLAAKADSTEAKAQPLTADMFWDHDDIERFGHDIDEIVADYGPGEIVKIDQAKHLPTITVRVIVDPEDYDRLTYEEVGIASSTKEGNHG